MTNKTEQELLEEAVSQALATPAPVQEKEERKPYFHETVGYRRGFPVGSKKGFKQVPKLDVEGNTIPHGNQGIVYKLEKE